MTQHDVKPVPVDARGTAEQKSIAATGRPSLSTFEAMRAAIESDDVIWVDEARRRLVAAPNDWIGAEGTSWRPVSKTSRDHGRCHIVSVEDLLTYAAAVDLFLKAKETLANGEEVRVSRWEVTRLESLQEPPGGRVIG